MIRDRFIASLALTAAAVLCPACGQPADRPGEPSTGPGASFGAAGGQGGAAGAPGTGAGGVGGDDASAGAGAQLGNMPVNTIPNTDCVPHGGKSSEVYAVAAQPAVFDRLATVAGRRLTGGTQAGGAYTMELDGALASSDPIKVASNFNLFASEGDTFGVVGSDQEVVYRRFDPQGQPVGDALSIAAAIPDAVDIAGREGEALVVWASAGSIHARGIDANGQPAGPAFEVASNAYVDTIALTATATADGFALAWTGDDMHAKFITSVAFASTTALQEQPLMLIFTAARHRVMKLERTQAGFVMMLTGAPPTFPAYLMALDEQGFVIGSGKELEGAQFGWDVAARGDELGVIAVRSTGEPQFRAFDANLEPLGPWVCLDAPTSVTTNIGAISSDGAGYAVLHRTADGAEVLTRFDRLGTSP